MSATTMLPPKMPPPNSVLHNTSAQHHLEKPNSELDASRKFEEPSPPANLTEDSMMILSQSVDSIHTLGTNSGGDEGEHQVRTIFVSGLPLDTKPRELYLLFRGFKGYLSSTLKPAGKNGKLTAPVGFVTFESREQAEEVMTKLQGIKFDPEGNQHMRLEFARTNTKVTKPKFPASGTFNNLVSGISSAHTFQSCLSQHAGMNAGMAGCPASLVAGTLPGIMAGLQPSLFSQLATIGAGGAFEPSPTLFTPQEAGAAGATGAHWPPLHGTHPMASAYENATYLTSAAGLLQANNFRALLPPNLNAAGFNLPVVSATTSPSLQMVQAAIAQANAAATLGATCQTGTSPVCPGSILSMSPQCGQTQLSPVLNASACSTPNSTTNGSRTSPVTVSRVGTYLTATPATQTQAQMQINPFMAQFHQQQQQQQQQSDQALAAVQLGQIPNSQASQQHHSMGFTNVSPSATALPHHMAAAAAIGLLGGYSSLVKELTGGDSQLQSGLATYQQNTNF
ncbi:unnamed protein product [Calicophoron daubneyi]|uniref:RRM domain-containing protein n=1 Tax=Calicophoron daubneyi TaxID=300641 RepID=A0AAV2TCX9_CALDB